MSTEESRTRDESIARLIEREDLNRPAALEFAGGTAVVFSRGCPDKEGPNEDACGLFAIGESAGLVVVADGAGGTRSGAEASGIALREIAGAIGGGVDEDRSVRAAVLDGVEAAHEAIAELGVGAGTTVAAFEIDASSIRTYHAGDSQVLVCGQRGKVKLLTMAHAPVAYGVEAGVIDADDALHHEDRHLVSNLLGTPPMRIEVGVPVAVAPRDTVIAASDGVFDNLHVDEIVALLRCGPLVDQVDRLVEKCAERMEHPEKGEPCKPDDLTIVAWRPASR